MKKRFILSIILVIVLVLSVNTALGIPDPAAVYCVDMGYEHETTAESDSSQEGICHITEDLSCDSWDYYKGKCGQEYSLCAKNGLDIITTSLNEGAYTKEYAVCVVKSQPTESQDKITGMVQYVDSIFFKNVLKWLTKSSITGYSISTEDLNKIDYSNIGQQIPLSELYQPFFAEEKNEKILDGEVIDSTTTQKDFQISAPTSFDWRNYNGQNWVTAVRDQGACGSCWAFAAVGATEPKVNIELNNQAYDIDLSEQDLISCSSAGDCAGGYENQALSYMQSSGIVKESCFAYTATNNLCSNKCANWANELTKITYSGVSANANSIKEIVSTQGPVTVGFYACDAFQSYSGGIFTDDVLSNCGGHAMVLVGYSDSGQYWIIKNSWGTGWGESGYIRVAYSESAYTEDDWWYTTKVLDLRTPYIVTSTDIDNDGTRDSNDACYTTYGTWCNGCPQPSCGTCTYAYCPNPTAPYCANSSTSTACNSTFQCSQGPGNNNYSTGGEYSCQGGCDGSASCDYAINCYYSTTCDPDDDNDGINDTIDSCPTQAGPSCNNGCPDSTAPSIIISNPPLNNIYQNKYENKIINITISDSCLNHTWWSIDEGLTNNSISSPFDINISNWTRNHYTLLIFANDSSSNLNKTIYQFTIDHPPNITSFYPNTTNLSVNENSSLSFNHTSTDPDNDNLTYSWKLDGLTQNTSQNWTFYPGFFDAGIRNLTLVVFDGDLSATNYWNVTVNNVNRLPFWDPFPENQTIEEDNNLEYDINASDLDNETITYYVNDTDFSINSSLGILTYSPPQDWWGIEYITVTATDSIANITANLTINVTPVNDAPVLNFIFNVTVNETDLINITVNASDVEGDNLTYSINDTKFTKINQSFTWQTTTNDSGVYSVEITVSDSLINDSQTVTITIIDVPDADMDNIPDYLDIDDDNDGINDTNDSITGDSTYVDTNYENFTIEIDGDTNLSKGFNGICNLTFKQGNRTLIEFEMNLSQSSLYLRNITISNNNTVSAGAILIKGIDLGNGTKTVYVDDVSTTISTLCIKDAQVASINEINTGCNGANEYYITCPGSVNGYTCSLNGSKYKVTGLHHSAIEELYVAPAPSGGSSGGSSGGGSAGAKPQCSDKKDNDGDGLIDMDDPGCVSESDSDETDPTACIQLWSCNDWSDCLDGKQTRTCYDANDCWAKKIAWEVEEVIEVGKPMEEKDCVVEEKLVQKLEEPPSEVVEEEKETLSERKLNWSWIITSAAAVLLSLSIGVYFIWRKKKSKG